MKIKIFISISLVAFLMNGCVIDRIKQRLYMKQQHKKIDVKKEDKKQELYKPSKSPLLVEEMILPIEEAPDNKPVSNSSVKKVKVAKKSSKREVAKRKVHSVKKQNPEPYSIEKNENDPELLGPQTTMESNPLTKVNIDESKKKI